MTSDRETWFTTDEAPVFGSFEAHAAAFTSALLHLRALHLEEDSLPDPAWLPVGTINIELDLYLSLGAQTSKTVKLSLPITVPALPIPTIAVFFTNEWPNGSFPTDQLEVQLGRTFIMLPGNSPLTTLNDLARRVADLAGALHQIGSIASFATLITGLSDVGSVISGTTDIGYLQFRSTDGIGDLEDVVFVPDFWGDVDADDRFRSLLFVGLPGCSRHTVQVFNDNGFDTGQGEFDATLDDFTVMVPKFDAVRRGQEPPGVTVVHDPGGQYVWDATTFSSGASSTRFLVS